MNSGLLALESLRYLFGSGRCFSEHEREKLSRFWDGLEICALASRALVENLKTYGASFLISAPGFGGPRVLARALELLPAGVLCLHVPYSDEALDVSLVRAATASGMAGLEKMEDLFHLSSRVVFVLERGDLRLSPLWLQPGSRSAGALRRLLLQMRSHQTGEARISILGALESLRPGAPHGAVISATGDDLGYLAEAVPGLVTLLSHLDTDGLSLLLRGPFLQIRRPSAVAELESHPAARRRLAATLRLLPQWRGNGHSYPLHPLAWVALPRLCAAYPHPERNLQGFFADEVAGSLPYFLANSKIMSSQGEPNSYPLDALYTYFEPVWRGKEMASLWDSFEALCKRARDLPFSRRLLRGMWLLQSLHNSAFQSTQGLLLEALQLGPREMDAARSTLQKLLDMGFLACDGFGEDRTYSMHLGAPARRYEVWQTFLRRFGDSADLKAELRAQLPSRRLKLYQFNRVHHSDRWVKVQLTSYQSLREAGSVDGEGGLASELTSLGRAPYAGDLLLLYVALLDEDERRTFQEELMQGRWRHCRLILAYPKAQSEPLRSTRQDLRTLAAYRWGTRLIMPYCDYLSVESQEMATRAEQLHSSIARKFRLFFAPENLDFYCAEGGVESNLDISGLHRFLHERFMRVAGELPQVPDKIFASAQERHSYRTLRARALQVLLQGHSQVCLWEKSDRRTDALIRGLVHSGLAVVIDKGSGWYLVGPPAGQASFDSSNLRDTYVIFEDALMRSSQNRESMQRSLELISHLTRGCQELLLAAFFWGNGESCQLLKDGDVCEVTSGLLADVVTAPAEFSLRYGSHSNDAQGFLAGITLDLDVDFQGVEGVDLWKAATRRLLDWYRGLHPQTVAVGRERTPFNRPLLELLERAREGGFDYRLLLEKELPAALGFSAEGRRNWAMETQTLLDRFRLIRVSIERSVSSTRELLHLGLVEIFYEPTLTLMGRRIDWPELVARWYANLPESIRRVKLESPLHLFLSDCDGGEQDAKLDESLAEMAYPMVEDWLQDYVPEILERFRLAKEEIENADVVGLFPAAPQMRWQRLEELVRRALLRTDLAREELRNIAGAELESFWER